jgi:uncharacterized membrane protein YhaH (DUF805 family)
MPDAWSLQTSLLVLAILLWTVAQYGLAYRALRDLARRPRVRGDNKVVWALVILILPFVGALLYAWMGPTSFLPRASRLPGGTTPAPPPDAR